MYNVIVDDPYTKTIFVALSLSFYSLTTVRNIAQFYATNLVELEKRYNRCFLGS